ncbi:MAG TPA: hypothetical protein VN922_19700 [Bacteroidia bacterium]|nr:hypothetical protein [Bacteroidia bacterium]
MTKIAINLNKPLLDLDGAEIPNANIGKAVAAQLAGSNKGEALKFYDWAVAMHKGEDLSVDKSDFKKIYDFIKDSDVFTNILKAQAIQILDAAEKSAQ